MTTCKRKEKIKMLTKELVMHFRVLNNEACREQPPNEDTFEAKDDLARESATDILKAAEVRDSRGCPLCQS